MARVELNSRGLDLLEYGLGDFAFVERDVRKRAARVERTAKRLCPVDTGRLRSSIKTDFGRDAHGLYARVGSDVEYAPYVELGTRHQNGQPFLRPAMTAAGGVA